MPVITESDLINDVLLVDLNTHADDRGRFTEIFRKEWFPTTEWNSVQSNRSESAPGVLRGLHYHHKQVDYWYVMNGTIRACLADLRRSSPTFKSSQTIELSGDSGLGLFIPTGVAHGFYALTPATLIYIVDQYYDGNDEFGVLWSDPALGIEWGVSDPILSARDQKNLKLADLPVDEVPA